MPFKECSIDGCERHGRPLRRQVNDACAVEGCARDAVARQLCRTHYRRLLAEGDPQADKPIRVATGTGYTHWTGYFIVPVPPELRHLTNGETAIALHRLVMAQMLGRPLRDDESVHHRNGDRKDCRPENLELWSRWQPSGQRVADKVAFALLLLRRYAPELVVRGAPRGRTRFCTGQLSLDL